MDLVFRIGPGCAVALLCLSAACSRPPERFAVAATLAELESLVPLLALGPDGSVVGEDHRPSFETPRQRPLTPEGPPVAAGRTVRQAYRVGPLAKGLPLLITRGWKLRGELEWRSLPPVRVVPEERLIEVAFEVDEQLDAARIELTVRAFLIPTMPRSRIVDDLVVATGSVLIGAFGLDPVSQGISGRPVEFRVVASGGGGRHVLLEETLDPAASDSFRWTDYRIALDEFVGRTVHLELSSTQQLQAGDDPAQEVSFPVWTLPSVIAPQPADQPDPRNVLLISLDTLRADYVGAYGQPLPTTPNLDRFASEGALFENAYTTYPSTTASHMSMLTGLYPAVHGAYGPTRRVAPAIPLLAEILRERGYRTTAVTEDAMLAAAIGFPRGFDVYREYKSPNRGTGGHVGEVVDSALAWLAANRDERFFMFLHTYQVHGPYAPPPAYDVFKTQPGDLKAEFAEARRGYAGDLLYTDAEIGRLLAGLEAIGEDERTIVVITADHGEELGDHGVIGHGWYATDPVMRVPLLVRVPGVVPPGVRIAASASLVDVTPTVLDLIGGPASGVAPLVMQGASLVPLFSEPTDPRSQGRAVYGEQAGKDGAVTIIVHKERRKWKTIGLSPVETLQHFDLRSDPKESNNLSDPEALAEGSRAIASFRAMNDETRAALDKPKPVPVQVDDATQHKLRALGYVE